MDAGTGKEYDSPFKLLALNDKDDEITNKEGHFASMVEATGKKTSRQLFEISKASYMEKKKNL
jgi:hypothetical protein